MSSTTFAIDALTRHQVYLQRYNSGEVKKMMPFISQMLRDVRSKLINTPTERLIAIESDLSSIVNASMTKMNTALMDDLSEFGEYESGFTKRLLDKISKVETAGVNVDQVFSAINDTPMTLISGKRTINTTINQAINQFSSTTSQTLNNIIRSGIAQGSNTTDMAKEITRVVTNRTRAQAEALVRTAANHAGTVSRNQVYSENSDIIEKEEFVATLDGNTSLTCAGFDGQTFDLGAGPMPALHFNCRSVRIPIIDPAFTVAGLSGERASSGADGGKPVHAKSTYGGWLRKQPASFQNEALGPERADLFRNGRLSIDKFTNTDGVAYTLDELRVLEPQAFE